MGKGKDLSQGEKSMIVNLYNFFIDEKKNLRQHLREAAWRTIKKAHYRVSTALGVSTATVTRCVREAKVSGTSLPPQKKNHSGRRKIVVDSFTEGVIRRKILEGYRDKKFYTVQRLYQLLSQDPNFPQFKSYKTLHNIMKKQLKFKFVKFHGKPIPFERFDVQVARHKFLRDVRRYRRLGYKIFYTDETWANENQSPSKGWHIPDAEVLGMGNTGVHVDQWLKGVGRRFADGLIGGVTGKPSGAGKRVIIVGIGSKDGFLTSKCFKGDKTKKEQDYHSEMNAAHFEEWFSEVLDIIPPKSIIVIDQASYHKRVTADTKNPTTAYRKQQIIDWLVDHEIDVPEDYEEFKQMTVPILLSLAREHKVEPVYVLEKMAEDCGKDIKLLWLPVAHCELNAIELIWSAVKHDVANKNTTFKVNGPDGVLQLCKNSIDGISPDLWSNCCDHVIKLENMLVEQERLTDDFLAERLANPANHIVINLGVESDDSDSDDENEDNPIFPQGLELEDVQGADQDNSDSSDIDDGSESSAEEQGTGDDTEAMEL